MKFCAGRRPQETASKNPSPKLKDLAVRRSFIIFRGPQALGWRAAIWTWTWSRRLTAWRTGFGCLVRLLHGWHAKPAKLECTLEPVGGTARHSQRTRTATNGRPHGNSLHPLTGEASPPPATKVRVRESYRRIGIVFYTQQRRYFTDRRFEPGAQGLKASELSRETLEEGLRCRVFRLARPRMWKRMRFCLDKQGRYNPEWEAEFRRVRQNGAEQT